MSETLPILNPHLALEDDMPKRKPGRPKGAKNIVRRGGNLGDLLKEIKSDKLSLEKKIKRAQQLHEFQGKQLG